MRGDYNILYARYLKNAQQLVDMVAIDREMSYLDLCGGTGAVSKELIRRGAVDVTILDLNENMLKHAPRTAKKILANANEWKPERKYDVIFCRQAITYLNLGKLESVVSSALKEKGVFVFNLVGTRSSIASLDRKGYELGGKRYREITLLFLGRAYHLQCAEGMGRDFTTFRMYTRKDIESSFTKWSIETRAVQRSLYFKLKKKV